jgi:hypothetical protein
MSFSSDRRCCSVVHWRHGSYTASVARERSRTLRKLGRGSVVGAALADGVGACVCAAAGAALRLVKRFVN